MTSLSCAQTRRRLAGAPELADPPQRAPTATKANHTPPAAQASSEQHHDAYSCLRPSAKSTTRSRCRRRGRATSPSPSNSPNPNPNRNPTLTLTQAWLPLNNREEELHAYLMAEFEKKYKEMWEERQKSYKEQWDARDERDAAREKSEDEQDASN